MRSADRTGVAVDLPNLLAPGAPLGPEVDRRRPIVPQVHDALRDAIVRVAVLPGQAISETEMAAMAAAFPHLGAMMAEIVHEGPDTTIGWCDDQTEFEFGLDVLLDGLERRRASVG